MNNKPAHTRYKSILEEFLKNTDFIKNINDSEIIMYITYSYYAYIMRYFYLKE